MDDERSADALTDAAIDRAVEQAVAVEPAPEFLARVRSRLSSEPAPSWSPLRWGFSAAGAIAVVIVLAVAVQRPERTTTAWKPSEGPAVTGVAQATITPPTAAPAAPQRSAARQAPATRTPKAAIGAGQPVRAIREPEVIIAADEAAAFRRLISDVRLGRVDLALLPEHPAATVALQPRSEISIAPITLEPLNAVTAEGEPQ
jgi:hypothetical protein